MSYWSNFFWRLLPGTIEIALYPWTNINRYQFFYCAVSRLPDNSFQKKLDQYNILWCHNFCLKYMFCIITKWPLGLMNIHLRQKLYTIGIVSGSKFQKELSQYDGGTIYVLNICAFSIFFLYITFCKSSWKLPILERPVSV